MKRWFGWVFAGWAVVGLLLSLVLQAGVNHQLHARGDGSVDCWRESVLTSPRALLGTSTELIHSRAGPLQSLAIHYALTTMDVGPSWLDTRSPPGAARERPWVVANLPPNPAAQSNSGARFLHEIPTPQGSEPKEGVLQQALANFRRKNEGPRGPWAEIIMCPASRNITFLLTSP